VKLLFDAEQFLLLVLFNRGNGDAGPARDDFLDIRV